MTTFARAIALERHDRSAEMLALMVTAQRGDQKAIDRLFDLYRAK